MLIHTHTELLLLSRAILTFSFYGHAGVSGSCIQMCPVSFMREFNLRFQICPICGHQASLPKSQRRFREDKSSPWSQLGEAPWNHTDFEWEMLVNPGATRTAAGPGNQTTFTTPAISAVCLRLSRHLMEGHSRWATLLQWPGDMRPRLLYCGHAKDAYLTFSPIRVLRNTPNSSPPDWGSAHLSNTRNRCPLQGLMLFTMSAKQV